MKPDSHDESASVDDARAGSLEELGQSAYRHGAFAEAEKLFISCLDSMVSSSPDPAAIARLTDRLGLVFRETGRYTESRDLHSRALALWRDAGQKAGVALALGNLGVVARELGQLDEARRLFSESLALREQIGDRLGEASALGNLGTLAAMEGRLDEAATLHERCLAIRRSLDDSWGIAAALNNLGGVARLQGDLDLARERHAEAFPLVRALGDQLGLCETLEAVAGLVASKGSASTAAQMLGAADALRAAVHAKRPPSREVDVGDITAAVNAALGDGASKLYEQGRAMSRYDVVHLLETALAGPTPAQ